MCLFEPIYGRYPNCDGKCGKCNYNYLFKEDGEVNEMRVIDADELKTAFPCGEYVRTESVRATIDHMPTIQMGGWIPCSIKKHPDSKIECYVTVKDYTDDYGEEYDLIVDVDTYYPEHDAWDYYCDSDIIAWMPKNEPKEPYQER